MTLSKYNKKAQMDTTGLTDDQANAARTLNRYQAEGVTLTALFGYAGTGKTELTLRRIQHVIDTCSNPRILVIAPTHKARANLWNKAKGRLVQNDFFTPAQFSERLGEHLLDDPDDPLPYLQTIFETVAKALGKERVEYYETGETRFEVVKDPCIRDFYSHCFIDEVSMVGESDWRLLEQYVFPYCVTEVVGDPAQLPPVKDGAESPAFQIEHNATLTHVVRNAGGILKNSFRFRDAQRKSFSAPLIEEYENVVQLDWSDWISKFISLHQAGYDCRIITYRNTERAKLNSIVREWIYKDLPNIREFEPGEKIMAINATPIKDDELKEDYQIRNFSMYSTQEATVETVELLEYPISECYYSPDSFDKRFTSFPLEFDHDRLWYWFLEVKTDEGDLVPVRQIHHSSRNDFQNMKDTLRTWMHQAKKHRDNNRTVQHNINELTQEKQRAESQEEIDRLKERLRVQESNFQYKDNNNPKYEEFFTVPDMHGKELIRLKDFFHSLQYSYAITAHKSQGSTYDYAFLHGNDLYDNKKRKERLQLLYVAVTRPSIGIFFCEDRAPSILSESESQAIAQEENPDSP